MEESDIIKNVFIERKYDNFLNFYNDVIHYKGKYHEFIQTGIFRGHSSENFELIPKVLRLKDNDALVSERYKKRSGSSSAQEFFEKNIIKRFRDAANFYSLKVPNFSLKEKQNYWDHENFGELAGLAQHYGLPTRLLDWTHEINTALYFAVTGNIDEEVYGNGDYIVVWVLDLFETTFINEHTIGEKILENLIYITPDYHSNPNLGAQKGIFTFWKNNPNSKTTDKRPLDVLVFEACKKYYKSNDYDEAEIDPIIAKFMINKKEIHEAFLYLMSINWGASKLFPGYGGVVRELQEQSFFKKNFQRKKNIDYGNKI